MAPVNYYINFDYKYVQKLPITPIYRFCLPLLELANVA